MPAFVVIAVYLVSEVGLDPLELVLIGTVIEVAVFVFEIPTGVFADTYGRKLSMSSASSAGRRLVARRARLRFIPILIAWALWGFGYTFMSGAYEAWITDEVGVGQGRPGVRSWPEAPPSRARSSASGSASPSRRTT